METKDTTQLDFIAWMLYDNDCKMDDRSSFRWLLLNAELKILYLDKAKSSYELWRSNELISKSRRERITNQESEAE